MKRPLLAEIKLPIARNRRKEGVEQVIALLIEQSVVLREDLLERSDGLLYLMRIFVINHDRETKLPEVFAFHAKRG